MVENNDDLSRRRWLKRFGASLSALAIVGAGVGSTVAVSRRRRSAESPLGCKAVKAILTEYSDNRLEPEAMAKVAAHLNLCSSCYNYFHENIRSDERSA